MESGLKIPYQQILKDNILLVLFATIVGGFTLSASTIKAHSTNNEYVILTPEAAGIILDDIENDGFTWTPNPDYIKFKLPANYRMILVRLCPDDRLKLA